MSRAFVGALFTTHARPRCALTKHTHTQHTQTTDTPPKSHPLLIATLAPVCGISTEVRERARPVVSRHRSGGAPPPFLRLSHSPSRDCPLRTHTEQGAPAPRPAQGARAAAGRATMFAQTAFVKNLLFRGIVPGACFVVVVVVKGVWSVRRTGWWPRGRQGAGGKAHTPHTRTRPTVHSGCPPAASLPFLNSRTPLVSHH